MKKDKKFFICAMLVLTIFLCVSASSATEPLNDSLGADIADELAISDATNDELSVSGDTFVVDTNETGDYSPISAADSVATGGENGIKTKQSTIFGGDDLLGVADENVVTNDTFYNFFDKNGLLNDSITYDELIFKGDFSNLAEGYVIITKPLTITGSDAVLKNMGFVIESKGVTLDNLTLLANTSLGNLINVGASNINLTNLNISYNIGKYWGNVISVSSADTITNVNILNNNIYFESHTKTDEDLVTAINLDGVEDIIVNGNNIVANIPSLCVDTYDYDYFMMGLCYVNPIRLREANTTELTNNNVEVVVNSYDASYPTVQSLYIVGSEDIIVKGNNITMRDNITPEGTAIYLYAVECGFSDGIYFIDNNFDISTTGGKSGAGSAYALQVATSEATFIGNNITCESNGPNLGIYSPMGFGPAKDLIIKENFINVTGYAAGSGSFALISGIEVQTGYATIYNNTIYVQNKEAYNEKFPVAGVSAVQSSAKTLLFDIQDNEIYTNGKYAVDIRYAPTAGIVIGNYLLSNDFQGDKAVYFKSGNNNIVENNTPTNVVTNDTFFNFFDDEGVLFSPNIYKELIFNGTFSNLTDVITINAPVSIVGENAVLNDIAIKIISDKVKLDNLTLNSDKEFAANEGALIYATGSNIGINDVIVNYTAPIDVEAIGIYAKAADNFTLTNSEIIYVGINPGSKHNYGLEVRDSENVSINNNVINATLPAVQVLWGSGIDQDLVLAAGIQGGKDINFTENNVNVRTNGGIGGYPTIDAIMIWDVDNVLINFNNITHIDINTTGAARYYYSVDIYRSNATVDNNNILLNTTSGADTGTAYPVQLTGPFTVTVSNNNLTSISRGPNSGIYAANWAGYGDLTVTDNIIDVTGYATTGNYAVITGIESEIDVTRIYNNIIKVTNLADYNDTNQVYGVSMVSTYVMGDPVADIMWNNMSVDGKYAVYYIKANNTNVTFNELITQELEGNDAALIESGDNNYIDINFPPYLPKIIIEANATWIGNDVTVDVTVVNTTGNVTIKVNEKEFKDLVLVDSKVSQLFNASDLVPGVNNVTVTFTSTDAIMRSSSENYTFWILDGVVTQDNYINYFNQEDNGKLFDYVPEGATLDFQGSIINPDTEIVVQMNVNKPVNIVSTTKDAYVDLNTTAGSLLGESPGNSFAVTRGGSGSNVTGIYFHNTQIWISNTTHVVLDNISVVVEDQRVGSGVGATSIRDNSSNVVLKNSYLYTRNNGGSTTFTMSWAENCTIDNCTVKAEGNVGNLIYLNTFNIVGAPSGVPLNNNNKVTNNRIYGKEGSGISVGLMVEGQNNTIENNTLYKASISNSFGAQKPDKNIYVGNVMTEGGSLTAQTGSIVYNNNVTGSLTTGKGSVVYNNVVEKYMSVTAGDANVKTTVYNNTVATYMSVGADTIAYDNVVGTYMTVAARAVAHDNTVGTYMTVSGANAVAYDNKIGTTVTISGKNTVVEGNDIVGAVTINKAATNTTFVGNNVNATVTVNSDGNNIKDNTIITTDEYAIDLKTATGNNVTDNYLESSSYYGDASVKYAGENNIADNDPKIIIDVVADAVWIGSNGTVVVTVVNGTGNVTIKVNDKEYVVDLDENGTAVQVIPAEELAAVNNVTATYETAGYLPTTVDAVLAVLDGVITNETYKYYFDEKGNLASGVPNNVTLDFQGLFLGNFPVYIDKSVNVVSSTGDALFDAGEKYAGNAINSFNIVAGGDNTNITGLDFINYCLYIKGASNVTVDNISIVANKRGVGSGTGFLSIHTGAYNTLVKNGYFENGGTGSSLLVLGKGGAYAVFDHNVFNITGSSGNILSANQFVGQGNAPEHVSYTNNVLYNSQPGSAFCYAMTVSGSGNLVENNTIYHNGSGILNQYGATSSGNVYRNNTLYGKTNFNPSANSIVENNKIYATTTNIAANTTVENNVFTNVAISGTNTTFTNNEVNGTVTVSGNENTIKDNTIITTDEYAVDLKSTVNNTVVENVLYAKELVGDAAVKSANENNTINHNYPLESVLTVEAKDISVGEDAIIDIKFDEPVEGTVEVIVNGKKYNVDVADGTAQFNVSDLPANKYTVGVYFDGDLKFTPVENLTEFTVEKLDTQANVNVPSDVKVGEDAVVTVDIPGATGNVSVIVDGVENVVALDENGTATYTIPAVSAGDHSVVVAYGGDDANDPVIKTATFSVDKEASEANVTIPTDFKVGEEANVTVDIPGATGNVSVIVDGVENVVPLDENGTAVVPMNMTAGDHSIVVVYSGDEAHSPVVKTATVTAEIFDTQFTNLTIHKDLVISGVLVNSLGDVLNNTVVTYSINGEKGTVVTGADGSFAIQGKTDAVVSIAYEGDNVNVGTNITINIENPLPTRIGTQFNVSSGYVMTSYAVEYNMGERGSWFDVRLTDENGNPISNETVQFGMNSVVMNMSTDANGVSSRQINYLKANTYTLAVCYLGNITHEASFIAVKVVVNKKPISISAAAKTYKATAKSKKYTVTLKTIPNVIDGKTYLKAGKKVTMKINGKTYSAKIDSKGQATFNLNINKKGKYSATVKFAGDSTYEAASTSVKITIN